MEGAEQLERAVQRLVRQVSHWEPARWSAAGPAAGSQTGPGDGSVARPAAASRRDRVHALVQSLADAAAEVEGEPRRPVPHLGDHVLPDQLRVMADDLIAAGAGEETIARATADIDALRRTL